MIQFVRSFIRDESGEDLIEYGLLAAFVAGIALAVIINDSGGIRTSLRASYQKAADALDGAEAIRPGR
jgi:Flp pilus assembly pilin Flp